MKKNIRILLIYHDIFMNGGVETFIYHACKSLQGKGFLMDVLTLAHSENSNFEAKLADMGVAFFQLKKDKTSFFKGCLDTLSLLPDFLSSHTYDIVHIHSCSGIQSGLLALIMKKCGIKKMIFHSHLSSCRQAGILAIKHGVKEAVGKTILYFTDFVGLAPSVQAGRSMFPNRIFAKGKFKVVKNAIELEKFSYDQNIRRELRSKLSIEETTLVIGHVGRFSVPKNHGFILEVFEHLQKIKENSMLILVGEGELEDEVRRLAVKRRLATNIIFYGTTDQPEAILQAMDVFLFPSRFEGLGIAGIEAQAAGLPTLVSDCLPKELRVTDLLVSMPLSAGAEKWAERLLEISERKRKNVMNDLYKEGYDITYLSETLQAIYYSMEEERV